MTGWIDFRSDWARRIAFVVCAVAALSSVFFGLRGFGSFRLLRSAYEAGAPVTSSIRAWMTIDYVSTAYHAPEAALVERLGLSVKTDPKTSLRTLAKRKGVSPREYVQQVQQAVGRVAREVAVDQPRNGSSWLGTIGDESLAAVLIYGYRALALTILLGSIGLPLPGGVAATVAGSLAAQGRMSWMWAAAITLVTSVLGDAVAYGVGRALGHGVLERHGRWFGYTPQRSPCRH